MDNQNKYVNKIKENYTPHQRTKLDELKALDDKVKTPPMIVAYILGTIAALVLGVGMCLAMGVIGTSVMSATALMVAGVIIGCAGIVLCIANYYIYKALLNARKRKYGSAIISLSNELLNK